MVGIGHIEHFRRSGEECFTDHDVIDGALRLPGWIGCQPPGRRLQGQRVAQFKDMRRVYLGIEITQHDKVPAAVQFTGEKFELLRPRPFTQGQVHDRNIQAVKTIAISHQQGSAPRNHPGQAIFFHRIRLKTTQETVTRISHGSDFTVGLVAPEWHARVVGQVARLVDIARSQAARVHFLQSHHVVGGHQLRDGVQIFDPLGVRQNLLQIFDPLGVRQNLPPAMCDVMVIPGGRGARLDVETQKSKFLAVTAQSGSPQRRT